MSEYGCCVTMGQSFNYDKERIKHAFKGELLCGEDEQGFIYAPASKEECEKYILSAFDNAVYHCLSSMDSGRALDRMLKDKTEDKIDFFKYMEYLGEERLRFNDYHFELDMEWEEE